MQTRYVNYYIRAGAPIVISTCVNEGYSLYHVVPFVRLIKFCSFSILHRLLDERSFLVPTS